MSDIEPIQWLLIGGPAHGKTVSIKQGSRVFCLDAHYEGENYLLNGRLYRVGRCEPTPAQAGEIPQLISERRLRHIAGD